MNPHSSQSISHLPTNVASSSTSQAQGEVQPQPQHTNQDAPVSPNRNFKERWQKLKEKLSDLSCGPPCVPKKRMHTSPSESTTSLHGSSGRATPDAGRGSEPMITQDREDSPVVSLMSFENNRRSSTDGLFRGAILDMKTFKNENSDLLGRHAIAAENKVSSTLARLRHGRLEPLNLDSTRKSAVSGATAVAGSKAQGSIATVPKIVRQYWIGKKEISAHDLMKMAQNMKLCPNHQFHFFAANPKVISDSINRLHDGEARSTLMNRMEIKSAASSLEEIMNEAKTTDAWKGIPVGRLVSAYMGETDGPGANQAGASDILRMLHLWKGGIHMDVDVLLSGEFPEFRPKYGFLMHVRTMKTGAIGGANNLLASLPEAEIVKRILNKIAYNYKAGYTSPSKDKATAEKNVRMAVSNESIKPMPNVAGTFLLKHFPGVEITALNLNGQAIEPYRDNAVADGIYYKLNSELGEVQLVYGSGQAAVLREGAKLSASYSHGHPRKLPGEFIGPMDHIASQINLKAYKRSAIWDLKRERHGGTDGQSVRKTVTLFSAGPAALGAMLKEYIGEQNGWKNIGQEFGSSEGGAFPPSLVAVHIGDASWTNDTGQSATENQFVPDADTFHYRAAQWDADNPAGERRIGETGAAGKGKEVAGT